jgi:hypothetical protein
LVSKDRRHLFVTPWLKQNRYFGYREINTGNSCRKVFAQKRKFLFAKVLFCFLTKFVEQTLIFLSKFEFSDSFVFFEKKYNLKTRRFIIRKTFLLFAIENVEQRGNLFRVNIIK